MVLKIIRMLFFLSICLPVLWSCSKGNITQELENEFSPKVKASIVVNGREFILKRGVYQWTEQISPSLQRTHNVEYASPNEMARKMDAIPLKRGQEVKIEIEKNPKIAIYLWDAYGRREIIDIFNGNQITVPTNPGKYIYEVFAEWSNGKASYTFVIDIH
jgi:hypothetical protein